MIRTAPAPSLHRRWLDWKPGSALRGSEVRSRVVTPGSEGFEGTGQPGVPRIRGEDDVPQQRPNQQAIDRAVAVLNAAGVRLMRLDGVLTVGVWSGSAGLEVQALRVLEMDQLGVRPLEDTGIPDRYKVCRIQERHAPLSWAEWKAGMLNRLFKEQGITGQSGHIKAETVAHGAASYGRKQSRCSTTLESSV